MEDPFENFNRNELFSVAKELDLQSLIKLCKSNKRINDLLCKRDDIWYYILERDYNKYNVKNKLTDEILLRYPNIRALDASRNSKITDKSVKELKQLHTLDASYNPSITDISVKELKQLHTLDAYNNPQITKEGTKHIKTVYKN